MLSRYGRYLPALGGLAAALLIAAAPVVPSGKQDGEIQAAAAPAVTKPGDSQSVSAYERESLALDRAANGIGERANSIADAQRAYSFLQLILAGFGVAFTGVAAFFAWRATVWAKEAATQTKRSADADNEALTATREAAEDARKEAAQQAKRFTEQLRLMEQTMRYTADSAYAMKDSARAATRQAAITEDTARKRLRAYIHVEAMTVKWTPEGYPLFTVVMKNTGQTPALNVKAGGVAMYGDVETLAKLGRVPDDMLLGGNHVIGAGSLYPTALIVKDYKMLRGEGITSDRMLAVVGRLTYADVFGVTYRTEFGYFCTSKREAELAAMTGDYAMGEAVAGPEPQRRPLGRESKEL
jgi:hypothetical protein